MLELHELNCKACHSGDPSLSDTEIIGLHRQVPNWEIKKVDGIKRLERVFTFRNFSQAMLFVNKAGKVAEDEHHHPSILIEYDRVTLNWWTHKVKGLHLNDFIMAAKMDHLMK